MSARSRQRCDAPARALGASFGRCITLVAVQIVSTIVEIGWRLTWFVDTAFAVAARLKALVLAVALKLGLAQLDANVLRAGPLGARAARKSSLANARTRRCQLRHTGLAIAAQKRSSRVGAQLLCLKACSGRIADHRHTTRVRLATARRHFVARKC